MTKALHLGCGQNTRDDYHNVDYLDLDGVDEVVDLAEFPWPWADNSWNRIVAEHVFEHLEDMEQTLRECARILRPGGRLQVVVPIGMNAIADPDHEHVWLWDTPLYYCGERHWDVDVGLTVVERNVSLHTHLPSESRLRTVYECAIAGLNRFCNPGRWMFDLPLTSGEFTVVFEK